MAEPGPSSARASRDVSAQAPRAGSSIATADGAATPRAQVPWALHCPVGYFPPTAFRTDRGGIADPA